MLFWFLVSLHAGVQLGEVPKRSGEPWPRAELAKGHGVECIPPPGEGDSKGPGCTIKPLGVTITACACESGLTLRPSPPVLSP